MQNYTAGTIYFKNIIFVCIIVSFAIIFSGCGGNKIPLEERIRNEYVEKHRLDRFYELQERYDGKKVILWLNSEKDRSWFINFPIWAFFSIMPDLPEVLAGGGVLAAFYFVAWWIGVTLTGGGILAVLAYLGGLAGGIPGIPPAIAGILFFGTMFVILINLFGLVC